MFDPARIRFRPLAMDDLPLMQVWHNAPYVNEWWEKVPLSYEAVLEKHGPAIRGEEPIYSYIATWDDRSVGYIQWYFIKDFPYIEVAEDTAGMDVFIGEASLLHRGFGSAMIRRFVTEIVFGGPRVTDCIVGPAEENEVAIQAFRRAGFQFYGHCPATDEEGPKSLMRITRSDVAGVARLS